MNLDKIKELLALMNENDLAEVEIEEEGQKVRLRKTETRVVATPVVTTAPQSVEPATPPSSTQTPPGRPPDCEEIPSPMVGTFYRASAPDAEPYVKIGDIVEPDTVICIIEAMKVMNEIKAERHGQIVDILVENGDVVEYGQPLFLIRKIAAPSAEEKNT